MGPSTGACAGCAWCCTMYPVSLFACTVSLTCPDQASATRLRAALGTGRRFRVFDGPPSEPLAVVVVTKLRAPDPRTACDRAEARVVAAAGGSGDRQVLSRSATRLRLVAPFTRVTSPEDGDTWSDGPTAGDREPRRPSPGHDSAHA